MMIKGGGPPAYNIKNFILDDGLGNKIPEQHANYRQQLTSGGTGPSVGPIRATRAALGNQNIQQTMYDSTNTSQNNQFDNGGQLGVSTGPKSD
jgi:hypothetical protein